MANLTGPGASAQPVDTNNGVPVTGGFGVPALTISTERQAIIALAVEVGFVMMLGVLAEAGPTWGTIATLVLVAAWLLFLMGNAPALRAKFGGVFG